MANLTVTVTAAGLAQQGATVSVWPDSGFSLRMQRLHKPPVTAPTATAVTNSSGQVTLTGLSSVAYQMAVIDLRGVPNWFYVQATDVGAATAYAAMIPWSTPTAVTKAVSVGGDTVGGPYTPRMPWAPLLHFHETTAIPGALTVKTTTVITGQVFDILAVSDTDWHIVGPAGVNALNSPGFSFNKPWAQTKDGGTTWTFGGPAIGGASSLRRIVGDGSTITVACETAGNTWYHLGDTLATATATTAMPTVANGQSPGDIALTGTGTDFLQVDVDQSGSYPPVEPQFWNIFNPSTPAWVNGASAGLAGQNMVNCEIALSGAVWVVSGYVFGLTSYAVDFTTNSGGAWTQHGFSDTATTGAPLIINSTTWMVGSGSGSIYYTTNSGSTWTQILPATTGFNNITDMVLDAKGRVVIAGSVTGGIPTSGYMTSPPNGAVTLFTIPGSQYEGIQWNCVAASPSYWIFGGNGPSAAGASTVVAVIQP